MSAQPALRMPEHFLSDADKLAILEEAEAWIAMVLARSAHGHVDVRIRVDLKDRRVLGIRGGGEAARSGRHEPRS